MQEVGVSEWIEGVRVWGGQWVVGCGWHVDSMHQPEERGWVDVGVCVCVYVCVCAWVSAAGCMCVRFCLYEPARLCVYLQVRVRVYVCICVCVCVCVCERVCHMSV